MCRCTWERKTECWGGGNLVLRFYCAFACGHLYMSEWWMGKDKMPTNQSLHWQPPCCQHHMFVDLVMSMCVQGVLQKYTKLHNRLINSPFKSNETPVNITTHIVAHKLMKVSLSFSLSLKSRARCSPVSVLLYLLSVSLCLQPFLSWEEIVFIKYMKNILFITVCVCA